SSAIVDAFALGESIAPFGLYDDLVPQPGYLTKYFAQRHLSLAIPIHIGEVKEGDALLASGGYGCDRLIDKVSVVPVYTQHRAAECESRNDQIRFRNSVGLHKRLPVSSCDVRLTDLSRWKARQFSS